MQDHQEGDMRKDLWHIVDRLERILTGFIAILVGIVTIVVCWQVFDRYVLHKSPYWAEEFSVTIMMWMGLLGAACAVWTGDHMRLELLTKHLPARFGLILEILIDGAVIYFSYFLFKQGIELVNAMWTSQLSTIRLSIGITYLVIPISAAMMILFSILKIVKKASGANAISSQQETKNGGEDAR